MQAGVTGQMQRPRLLLVCIGERWPGRAGDRRRRPAGAEEDACAARLEVDAQSGTGSRRLTHNAKMVSQEAPFAEADVHRVWEGHRSRVAPVRGVRAGGRAPEHRRAARVQCRSRRVRPRATGAVHALRRGRCGGHSSARVAPEQQSHMVAFHDGTWYTVRVASAVALERPPQRGW